MTWKSIINCCPDDHEEGYSEWVSAVMEEPWFHALWGLVQADGVWVGTEEQLIDELGKRVGKEVRESEDFPSTLERLMNYQACAIDGFISSGFGVCDYRRELADGDLDDFDAPGWGPDAPVLVAAGDAAHRLHYRDAQFELLKYWHPLPVAILHLTVSRHFAGRRKRTFDTKGLAKALINYYPYHRNVPGIVLERARPEGAVNLAPSFRPDESFQALNDLHGREEHLSFCKQMRKWAPILKEKARIKVSWVKSRRFPGSPMSDDPEMPLKTWWTIEAPRWKYPDRFRGTWAIFSEDI